MRSVLCTAALTGAALVAAAPAPQGWNAAPSGGNMGQYGSEYEDNGFNFLDALNNKDLLKQINLQAHGELSDMPPPPPLHPDTFISLDLIATNELAEVKFFQEFLFNVTKAGDGFGDDQLQGTGLSRDFLIETLTVIVAVEELHALNAEGALQANGQNLIQPSQYQFPVNTLQEALAFANILTDNVLGVLQDVARRAADAGDSELINGFVAVVGEEGEQNGFFRSNQLINGKQTRNPSGEPFLTASARDLAFSALEQNVIVPGTDHNKINLTVFEKLLLETVNIQPVNQELQFQIVLDAPVGNDAQGVDGGKDRSSSGSGSSGHKRRGSPSSSASVPYSTGSSSTSSYAASSSGSSSYSGSSSSSSSSSSGRPGGLDLSQYGTNYDWQNKGSQEFFVTYITEQDTPISEPLKNVQFNKNNFTISFTADFPAADFFINGFAIATVTKGSNFTNAEDVADNTFAGPAAIELVD